jgi:monoamine oxidase
MELNYRFVINNYWLRMINSTTSLPVRSALENITLVPKLATPRQAELQAVATWMAGHSKVVVEYENAFWRDCGFSGDVISQIGPLSEVHDASSNIKHSEPQAFALFGFIGVPAAPVKSMLNSCLI